MARKKLLTEGEIRQFMKLANLRPIGKGRLGEMGYPTPPPGAGGDELEMDAEEEVPLDDGAPAELEMDAEEEVDVAPEGGGMVSMDDFMAALEQAIEEVTGEEADVSEDPGEEEEIEMDIEMGAEEDPMGAEEEPMMEGDKDLEEVHYGFGSGERRTPRMSAPKRTGASVPFGAPEEEEEEESEMLPATDPAKDPPLRKHRRVPRHSPGGVGIKGITSEEIVQEVASRVTARLQAVNRKEQMADQLAERIMKRLTK